MGHKKYIKSLKVIIFKVRLGGLSFYFSIYSLTFFGNTYFCKLQKYKDF